MSIMSIMSYCDYFVMVGYEREERREGWLIVHKTRGISGYYILLHSSFTSELCSNNVRMI